MMFGSPDRRHKHHHAKQYQSWDTSNGYPVYATTLDSMPKRAPEGHQYSYGYGSPIFNNYQECVLEDPRRSRVTEYEPGPAPAPVPVPVKSIDQNVKEDVDTKAEAFIRTEHKKFQISRLNSEISG